MQAAEGAAQASEQAASGAEGAIPPPEPPTLDEALALILGKLTTWWQVAVANLPNLLVAVVIAALFWILASFVRSLANKGLKRTPMPNAIRKLIVGVIGFAVLAAGFFVALGVLGLDRTVLALLGGVGILGLALGFAFQDIAANFMSGILIAIRKPLEVGDIVESNDYFGTVDDINLRATVVRRPTGELVHIPNKLVFENPIVNYSTLGQRRIDLGCGVAYGDDLEKAGRLAVEAVEAIETRDPEREVELFYTEFGDSSINFIVRFWIPYRKQTDFLTARGEAIQRIKAAFDEGGITIPFPIRTLDFGVVGGERLDDTIRPLLRGRATSD